MKDRNVQHASRFRLTKVPGTDDVYDLIPAPGEVYEEGTLINKSALLKDATAALFGLDDNAVPDDVLAEIGKYKQYWWKRKKVTYVEKEKSSGESLCYGRTTATVTYADSITAEANIANTAEYVRSSDRNAYPDSGIHGGYAYEYLGIPFENTVTALKAETGSYAGTGTCGESNPNILTFEFEPKAIFMWRILSNASDLRVYNALEVTTYISAIPADNVYYYGGFDSPNQTRGQIKRSIDGKTITWYSTDPGYQHNVVGSTYYYIAIG